MQKSKAEQILIARIAELEAKIKEARELFDASQDNNDVYGQVNFALKITEHLDALSFVKRAHQWFLVNAKLPEEK